MCSPQSSLRRMATGSDRLPIPKRKKNTTRDFTKSTKIGGALTVARVLGCAFPVSSSARNRRETDPWLLSSSAIEPAPEKQECPTDCGDRQADLPNGHQDKLELLGVTKIVAGRNSEVVEDGARHDHG